jgi:transposase
VTLLCLPPYSRGLNPIEMAFGTLKTLLRKAPARTRDKSSAHSRKSNAPTTSLTLRPNWEML